MDDALKEGSVQILTIVFKPSWAEERQVRNQDLYALRGKWFILCANATCLKNDLSCL